MPDDYTEEFQRQLYELKKRPPPAPDPTDADPLYRNGVIRIPAGDWMINRRFTIDAKGHSLSIVGEGRGVTTVRCNSADRTIVLQGGNFCTIRSLRFIGSSDWWATGNNSIPAIELGACFRTSIEDCDFTNHGIGIGVGTYSDPRNGIPASMAHKTRIDDISFNDCYVGLNMPNFLEAMVSNIWSFGGDPQGLAVINAEPQFDQVYDSLLLHNIHSTHSLQFGIRIVITTNEKGANGRNQIGQFSNLVMELCKGLYVDSTKCHGRLDLSHYYGERVEIFNCDDFHATVSQFQYGLLRTNCARSEVTCSYVSSLTGMRPLGWPIRPPDEIATSLVQGRSISTTEPGGAKLQ